jgi:hypothetical protein
MSSETPPTRRPIPALRVSSVALLGVVAAVVVPAGAAAIATSGSVDSRQRTQELGQAGPVSRVVIVDADSTVRVNGSPGVSGMTGKASLTWHALRGGGDPHVVQQYAGGVLTLTKDCGGTHCDADLDILVPPTVSVQVTNSNAGIEVANVSGGVDLHGENGAITATGLGSGDATMQTSNDSIYASFAGAPQNISAHTSNDHIVVITDGRTLYFDQTSTTNGQTTLQNKQDRFSANTIDAETTNSYIKIK